MRASRRTELKRRLVEGLATDPQAVELVVEESQDRYWTRSGGFDVRALVGDLFHRWRNPPAPVLWLKDRGVDGSTFFAREIAPSWEGLEPSERREKLDQFVGLLDMVGQAAPEGDPPDAFLDMVANVQTKVLVLSLAGDRSQRHVRRLIGRGV